MLRKRLRLGETAKNVATKNVPSAKSRTEAANLEKIGVAEQIASVAYEHMPNVKR